MGESDPGRQNCQIGEQMTARKFDGPMHAQSAGAIVDAIRRKEISSQEATQYFIDRIEQHDRHINAIPVRDFDRAMAHARAADLALSRGEPIGALHGLPITVKESFFVDGLPVTYGDPLRTRQVVNRDSALIETVRRAGAVILGKSNVPFMCADWQTDNAVYGETHNPWRTGRSPGGSSGGSAAALAAGLSPLELGSDRAGSIRVPASFCGIFGHKPTWGTVTARGDSLHGHIAPSDIATAGPMAKTAADLALFHRVLVNSASPAASAWRFDLTAPRGKSLKDYRIAVWSEVSTVRTGEAVVGQLHRLLEALTKEAKSVSQFKPFFDPAEARRAYSALRVAAVITGKSSDTLAEYRKFLASDPAEGVRKRHASFATMSHLDWARYNEFRHALRHAWQEFFKEWDVLICPVTLRDAFETYHEGTPETRLLKVDGIDIDYYDQEFWPGIIGMCYLPATVVPIGLSPDGLPIGVQVVSREGADLESIQVAHLIEVELALHASLPYAGSENAASPGPRADRER
ncbi:amidase family protein [Cupriavidus nantongensis]|uniref:amidase family protein n=1 Tax=Cupriavidus nantongensis TaxID=1796606 RepID=UPI00358F2519